ncbi:uncharacterized protein METZ01_LOCUS477830, partial [marine metagenome]
INKIGFTKKALKGQDLISSHLFGYVILMLEKAIMIKQ